MKVLRLESPSAPELPFMIIESLNQLAEVEATIGNFLGLPGEEQWLKPGLALTITVVEMTREEIDALPEWEY